MMDQHKLESTIAVIGLAGRFPGADNIAKFWENLKQGIESVSFFSDEELLAAGVPAELIAKPNYVKAKAYLEDVELFDADFFHFTPREAMLTDPQHRIFLECAWEALEDAGYDPNRYPGDIGVYAGCGTAHYMYKNLLPKYADSDPINGYQIAIGNEKDFLCTKVSYKLNLTGPSIGLQTACSTSLVAINTACQALLDHQCNIALAGGVSITLPKKSGYLYTEGMILSPDGHCRAFDANSAGIVPGNGVGVVVLKRLKDAINDGDFIYALVSGTALNNDGADKVGYTAPAVKSQASLISETLRFAEISPVSIGYVEAHGTGTALGDPVEISAISSVYRMNVSKRSCCPIGSVKTNLGHLDTAAGVAGFIKTVLCLQHKQLVPSLNFKQANPKLNLENTPFYVNTELKDWSVESDMPRMAAISSFGIGGTNAHAILEEAPPRESTPSPRSHHLILLSARTETALHAQKQRLLEYLIQNPETDIADLAYTLQIGRQVFEHRSFFTCSSVQDAIEKLQKPEIHPYYHAQETNDKAAAQVVFMFSGQGSQYATMSLDLYRNEPIFKRQIERCARLMHDDLNFDIQDLLYPKPEKREWADRQLQRTEFAQPILFALELSIANVWINWGVEPQAMIGHSLGEYVAAHLAGLLNLHEAIELVVERGRLMQAMEEGSMLAVALPEDETKAILPSGLDIAAINVHTQTVVSGPSDIIANFSEQLTAQGIQSQILNTSHAFHSAMMDPILPEFEKVLNQMLFIAPYRPYLCNVNADWANPTTVMKADYWTKHLRQPVRFADGLTKLFHTFDRLVLLEIGPGQTLTNFAKRHAEKNTEFCLASLQNRNCEMPDVEFIQHTIGKLWMADRKMFRWRKYYKGERRLRIPLPTYPFERQRYWVDAPLTNPIPTQFIPQLESVQPKIKIPTQEVILNPVQSRLLPIWQQVLGLPSIGLQDNFFDLGGDSLMAVQLVKLINDEFNSNIASQSLLNAPTIEQFAELITSLDEKGELTPVLPAEIAACLVEIQPGQEDKIPLFLIHPVGGHVYIYRDLAKCLGAEQPVYGLQSMAVHSPEQAPKTIEDMANIYLQAIRTKQPAGQPYYLAGSSFGGAVAFEIAQQLESQGENVKLLAMFDTPNVGESTEHFELDDTHILYYFAYLNRSTEELPKDWEQLSVEQRLQYLKNQGSGTFDDSSNQILIDTIKINMQAMWHYKPKPYKGKIIYFKAKQRDRLINVECTECIWIDMAKEGVEIYYTEGGHISMNYSPNIDKLKSVLDKYIL
jgi:phthiocerol/phenolphthiocerol synthesis type-I polyketide synthase E